MLLMYDSNPLPAYQKITLTDCFRRSSKEIDAMTISASRSYDTGKKHARAVPLLAIKAFW